MTITNDTSAGRYRALDMLTSSYVPKIRNRSPFWRPPAADVSAEVWEPRWTWRTQLRPDAAFQVGLLDANGAFLSAICTVTVGHEQLRHTPKRRMFDRQVPGLWLIDWHPWALSEFIVSPLGSRTGPERVWVTTPTMQLLEQLVEQGVWPGLEVYDSWTTPDTCRLRTWGTRIRDDRTRAIDLQDTEQLAAIKLGYSQAVTVMATPRAAKVYRPDWAQHIRAQAAASVWRRAWAAQSARIPVLGMGRVDEIVVHWDDVRAMHAQIGQTPPPPLIIDQSGKGLGTFKVKGRIHVQRWLNGAR